MSWLPKGAVVVPIDFSDLCFEALEEALEFVVDASHLRAIHVLPPLSAMEPGVVWGTVDDEGRKKHAEEALRKRLSDSKYEAIKVTIAIGDPGHEIVRCAEEIKADLIILPSHGRTGAKRLLIGSVADRVARLSHCPVLVLRK